MGFDILFAAIASLIAGGIYSSFKEIFEKISAKFLGKEKPKKTYNQRLTELTSNLIKSSQEVDSVILELSLLVRVSRCVQENLKPMVNLVNA
jgi:hypothetical protein